MIKMSIEGLKYCILLTLGVTLIIPIIGIIIAGIKNGVLKFFNKVSKGRGAGMWWFIYGMVLFPGTVFHEGAHALGALITGARVKDISVIPDRKKGTLGETLIEPRGSKLMQSLQLTVSATSPVSFGIIALVVGIFLLYPICTAFWQKAIITYLSLAIFFHMSMSTEDVKAWAKGIVFVLIPIFLIFLVLTLTGVILPATGLMN